MNLKIFNRAPAKSLEGTNSSSVSKEELNAMIGIDRGQSDVKEKLFLTLDGEEFYIALLSEIVENDTKANGSVLNGMADKSKEIVKILKAKFPEELEACKKLNSKECGARLWELYKLLEKN